MIRFIDLRGQGTGYNFAFWDTTADRFCEFFGDQAWDNKAFFEHSYRFDGCNAIERFLDLMPGWVE